ncbi:hypothetical protein RCZ01_09790 [Capnocytophaga felis]|uniref:Uncharacterized protein n=2 Tax=Capnocytophaga felis TaxID=2267611 RepID=A0A5M4B8Z9_9FLAO|nr:hypothetical protein RCZ01_09790 [Capnocytophaga felis]GET47901.1 hypothetical protein RCZ02_07320 [Capnocytophaga felis]
MRMKNIFTIFLIAGLLVGCFNKQKIKPLENSVKVEWTAYKTTDKLPVKGTFNSVKLEKIGEGTSVEEILNEAEFSLNSLDLATGDISRDEKIKKSFFGLMNEAGTISGKIYLKDNQWFVKLKMNGILVEEVPATVSYENRKLKLTAPINLKDFNALQVLEMLNSVCFDLHKGADGISKVWETVDVLATMEFTEK